MTGHATGGFVCFPEGTQIRVHGREEILTGDRLRGAITPSITYPSITITQVQKGPPGLAPRVPLLPPASALAWLAAPRPSNEGGGHDVKMLAFVCGALVCGALVWRRIGHGPRARVTVRNLDTGNRLRSDGSWTATLMLVVALLTTPMPARAQVAPTPVAADPVTFTVYAGTEADYTGRSHDSRVVAGVSVDGPLVIGSREVARVLVALDMRALPGRPAIDLSKPESWSSDVELHVGLERVVGRVATADQVVTTSVLARAGWATSPGARVLDRYPPDYGLLLKFTERHSGAFLAAGPGHNVLATSSVCVLMLGSFPLMKSAEGPWSVAIAGDAALGRTSVVRLAVQVRR